MADRSGWTIRKFHSFEEMDAADRQWRRQVPLDERAEIVWQATETLYRVMGKFPDATGLRRLGERVRRA